MHWQRSQVIALAVVAAAAAMMYFHSLGSSTPYLSIEEVSQAREALRLASPAGDTSEREAVDSGQPSSQVVRDPMWTYLAPLWVFAAAALLKILPFSESVLRVPSASAGLLNVVLMFAVAREIFGRTRPAVVASAVLMLSPAHFFQSRIATGQIGMISFVLAWLLFLVRYIRQGRRRDLFIATLALGVGTYTYAGGLLIMPVYFVISLAVAMRCHADSTTKEIVSVAGAGFGLAFMPLAMWHLLHPAHLLSVATYYTHGEYNRNLGWRGFLGPDAIRHLDAWWDCYNLDKLFFSGDADLRFSTRSAGYFLLAASVPMAVGVWQSRRVLRAEVSTLLISGLALATLPAALVSNSEIKRWLTFVPFAVLAATCGVEWLLVDRRRAARTCAIALLAAGALEARYFLGYYFGPYGADSAVKFGGNLRGAIREVLLVSAANDCVMLETGPFYLAEHWDLYTLAYGRSDLARKTVWFGGDAPVRAPTGCRGTTALAQNRDSRFAEWRAIPIPELDGAVRLTVYRRDAR